MPNCRSYSNSASGLCGYHEQKAMELEEASDAEQRTPEDRAKAKLWHAQTFEKFSTEGGAQDRHEQDSDYDSISRAVREAVQATHGNDVSRHVFDGLKAAQEQVKHARLTHDHRNELWQQLQQGFDNAKRAREARQQQCKDNYSRLWHQINGVAQEVPTTTDWRGTREQLKSVQQTCRDTDLLREDRDTLRGWIQNLFETLGNRQDAARKQYESECSENYSNIYREVQRACETARYGADFREAFRQLKEAQDRLRNASPMKREDRDALRQRIQDGFSALKRRQDEHHQAQEREREQKRREWAQRQKENLEAAMARLEESIGRDSAHLEDLTRKIYAVRPGRREREIRDALQRKKEEVANRRWDKQTKLAEMRQELSRLRSELSR